MKEYTYYDWVIHSYVFVPEDAKELYNAYVNKETHKNCELDWLLVVTTDVGEEIWRFHETPESAKADEGKIKFVFNSIKTFIYYVNHNSKIICEVV